MDWALAFLIVSLSITFFAFLWGIIKVFKKPKEDLSWKEPLDTLKKEIKSEDKECKSGIADKIERIDNTLIVHGNKIHDLEKDSKTLNTNLSDLKSDVKGVSAKCDAILDKVIEYMSKD